MTTMQRRKLLALTARILAVALTIDAKSARETLATIAGELRELASERGRA
jgi:hypothetical protein